MKTIAPTQNEHQWPRSAVSSVECRKRDLVIRITDWTDLRGDQTKGYDVEVYIGGVYDWNESKTFDTGNKAKDKAAAITFANTQTAKLL